MEAAQTDTFRMISYDKDGMMTADGAAPELRENASAEAVHWVDVPSLEGAQTIRSLGKTFGIHHLIVEDILNVSQMVKMDNYDDCLFLVLKMLDYNRGKSDITTEHVSILLKGNFVFSFQENGGDIFRRVRERIEASKDNIRKFGADYLCYELVDAVVDNYFNVIDDLGDVTDTVEEELISHPGRSTLSQIYFIKRKLMFLRKSVFPLRELIGSLFSSDSAQLGADVKIYFHDVYDHLIQIVDSIETYQDILSNMLDIYLSSVSNKTNDTMKILTIFSTIFIPMTFLAGIYGMNFTYIPELQYRYGYFVFWGVCIVIAGVMFFFFHKKKWL